MSELKSNLSASLNEPASLAGSSSNLPPAQATASNSTPAPQPAPAAAPCAGSPAAPKAAELNLPAEKGETAWEHAASDHARREKKARYTSAMDQGNNWLRAEPYTWVDRKVRNRSNAAVYTVRQVFKNSRVQLERNWMSYMTDVETVRTKYEPYV